MKTLEQIRQANRRHDLLFAGMESTPVKLPPDVQKQGKEIFETFVKPISKRVLRRYLDKK